MKKGRIVFVLVVIVLLFGVLFFKMVDLQVFSGKLAGK